MTGRTLALPAGVVLALGITLSGCSVGSSADAGPGRSGGAHRKDGASHRKALTGAPRWTCSWSPTMDDDWHNDVLCTNGSRTERPHLRPQDSFVEQAEMMASARAWARARNGG